ncbi:hypothetical protein KKJ28_19810, partial [Xenorhabdus bovienii]|nr:hypothetical protein [Xenorhabdus bovienii]
QWGFFLLFKDVQPLSLSKFGLAHEVFSIIGIGETILISEFILARWGSPYAYGESIDIYNRYRPHLALKYQTPDEVHHQALSKNSVNVYQD